MLINGPSGSGKTNVILNLIQWNCIQKQNNDSLIDKIFLYGKSLSEPKYLFLIKKREDAGIRNLVDPTHLLNTQALWMMFTTTLMITIQKEKEKF